jgi:glycosyltransferase involved in cell wall biosynthesis
LAQLSKNELEAQQTYMQSINQLKQQLQTIHANYTWRWTAPLRHLSNMLNQKKIGKYETESISETENSMTNETFKHFITQAVETPKSIQSTSSIIIDETFDMISTQNNNVATTLDKLLAYNDDLFVHNAYLTLLGRTPDTDGLNYYLGRLRSGITKIEIIAQIKSGVEGKNSHIHIEGVDEMIRHHNLLKIPFIGAVLRLFNRRNVKYMFKINSTSINGSKFDDTSKKVHDVDVDIGVELELEQVHNQNDNEETRVKKRIMASSLFDANWYLDKYPDLKNAGVDPLHHYVEYGAFEGRWASAFFHSDYYLNSYVDVAKAKINPLVHYINYGEAEGRRPSRFFDPTWYSKEYGIHAKVNNTYLMHFAKFGGFKTNPSPYFDAIRYFVDAPDVMKAGVNPLTHYLSSGIREGRRAVPTEIYPKATETQLVKLKNTLAKFKSVAIFITYTPDGFLRADIQHYINALTKNDLEVVLVIVSDQIRNYIPDSIVTACSTVFVRKNAGFDFGAWAHIMQALPEILNSNILYLLNDSMIGPISDIEFQKLLERIANIDAEIVGLTSNNEINPHIQSYFLAIKKKALCSNWLIQYFTDIVNLNTKDDVIFHYEVTFTARMKEKGFRCESVIAPSIDNINKTILQWSELLDAGIPFVKRSLVSGEHEDKGGKLVLDALKKRNYPVDLLNIRSPNLVQDKSISVVHLRGRGEFLIERINTLIEPMEVNKSTTDSKINVTFISPHNYSNGLGIGGRGYLSSLMHAKLQYNVHPISKPFHVHAKIGPDWIVNQFECAPDVVLIFSNPDGWSGLLDNKEYSIIESARRRIGLFVWELSTLPNYWMKGLNKMDAIIAPSEYSADIFRKYTTVPVYVVPVPVPVLAPPPIIQIIRGKDAIALREKNSIPVDSRLMLYAFDGSSFLARKNPFALVRAFKSSNLHRMGWHLVLKTKHLFDVPERGEELFNVIGNDTSITVMNNPLTHQDMNLLFDETEIYVSPHCSEGFGLTIAEAMSRGKIVVATDFGGSKDFLDATCGFPVRADIVSLQENFGPYQAGGQWAKIDEDALAIELQQAVDETNREYSPSETSMASRAIARVSERLSYSSIAKKLEYIVGKVNNDLQYSDRSRSVQNEQ